MAQPNFDFGALVQKSWQIFQKNVVVLLVSLIISCVILAVAGGAASLIAGRLSGIAIAVVQGPLALGFCGIALAAARGGSPQVPVLFEGFNRFLPAFQASLVISLPSIIGTAAGSSAIGFLMGLLGLVFSFLFGLTYFFMADKKLDFWPAIQSSQRTVMAGIGPWLILWIILFAMNVLGAIPCGLGLLVTMPMSAVVLALAYDQVAAGGYSVSEAPAHEDYQA